jgi:exopolyphosphatase/guanosine-5'-triphosphate,3'-diphosphate pyrophosphatase
MAKITAIIDIGSNSCRMVLFEKSSRFGFSILKELKSRIRISEGSYENGGYLQEKAINRAVGALEGFVNCAKFYKANKILCVATSAVRDAPNQKEFLKLIQDRINLKIKVINGEMEAYYGGVSTSNLLPVNDAVTADIGGGSTEFAHIKDGKILETVSINLGTVRLKELFFDKSLDIDGAKEFIQKELQKVPSSFKSSQLIGIGGTIRAISKVILKQNEHPINTLHGFEYGVDDAKELINDILDSNNNLKRMGFKKDRLDVIKEGSLIFESILDTFKIEDIITSGVGVREGVYLNDLLRTVNRRFPQNFNPSVKSLIDRFCTNKKFALAVTHTSKTLFDTLAPVHNIDTFYRRHLSIAARLLNIGVSLDYYSRYNSSFNFILSNLNYGFRHSEQLLIAHIIKFNKKSLPLQKHLTKYDILLPSLDTIQWLSFILKLSEALQTDYNYPKYSFTLNGSNLIICSNKEIYLSKERIDELELPQNLQLSFEIKKEF